MSDDEVNARSIRGAPPWCVLHEVDVARIVAQHATLRQLCDGLENCADRLPKRDAILRAVDLSAALAKALSHHEFVENDILSGLFDTDPAVEVNGLLGRIRHRHAVDHLHAEDLHDALVAAEAMLGPVRCDVLSYMMRCLFDGCRRGIDFQEAAVLMLARHRLTRAARATLTASLAGA